jgi:uncharacterized protein YukE
VSKKNFPKEVNDAIHLAYQINGTVGRNVEGMITSLWGDPGAIRDAAQGWRDASNAAKNSSQALTDEVRGITNEHWKGPAATAYTSWMQSLQQHSIDNLAWCFWEVGTVLTAVAKDVQDMGQYVSIVCAEFATIVSAILLKGKVVGAVKEGSTGKKKAAIVAAVAAAAELVRRLYEARSSYDQKLAPHAQTLRGTVESISDPSKPDICRIGLFTPQSASLDSPPLTVHAFASPYQYNLIGYWDRWE